MKLNSIIISQCLKPLRNLNSVQFFRRLSKTQSWPYIIILIRCLHRFQEIRVFCLPFAIFINRSIETSFSSLALDNQFIPNSWGKGYQHLLINKSDKAIYTNINSDYRTKIKQIKDYKRGEKRKLQTFMCGGKKML